MLSLRRSKFLPTLARFSKKEFKTRKEGLSRLTREGENRKSKGDNRKSREENSRKKKSRERRILSISSSTAQN